MGMDSHCDTALRSGMAYGIESGLGCRGWDGYGREREEAEGTVHS